MGDILRTGLWALLLASLHSAPVLSHGIHSAGAEDSRQALIGRPGTSSQATTAINIDMSTDLRFEPSSMAVPEGSTVLFRIRNNSSMTHEFALGAEHDLSRRNASMKTRPASDHVDSGTVIVQPGSTVEVAWEFLRPGTLLFGCLQLGHFDAGMLGAITILPRNPASSSENGSGEP